MAQHARVVGRQPGSLADRVGSDSRGEHRSHRHCRAADARQRITMPAGHDAGAGGRRVQRCGSDRSATRCVQCLGGRGRRPRATRMAGDLGAGAAGAGPTGVDQRDPGQGRAEPGRGPAERRAGPKGRAAGHACEPCRLDARRRGTVQPRVGLRRVAARHDGGGGADPIRRAAGGRARRTVPAPLQMSSQPLVARGERHWSRCACFSVSPPSAGSLSPCGLSAGMAIPP